MTPHAIAINFSYSYHRSTPLLKNVATTCMKESVFYYVPDMLLGSTVISPNVPLLVFTAFWNSCNGADVVVLNTMLALTSTLPKLATKTKTSQNKKLVRRYCRSSLAASCSSVVAVVVAAVINCSFLATLGSLKRAAF